MENPQEAPIPQSPQLPIPTREDFLNSGWKEALPKESLTTNFDYSESFGKASKKAAEDGHSAKASVLRLLQEVSSMMLNPSSIHHPFTPGMRWEGKRSTIPDDFSEEQLTFFQSVLTDIDDVWLKARIADVLWLMRKPRKLDVALLAIDSYRSIPLNLETWVRDGAPSWERAIKLAQMLKTAAGTRSAEMGQVIFSAFENATSEHGFFAYYMAKTLIETTIFPADTPTKVATKLEQMGREFSQRKNYQHARDYFTASADWYSLLGDKAKAFEMISLQAEEWVQEAEARSSGDQVSHSLAASNYEQAIQALRGIPHTYREALNITDRLKTLHERLSISGEKSLEEMGQLNAPYPDLTDLIGRTRDAIQGKELPEAFVQFAVLFRAPKQEALEKQALKRMKMAPLMALLGKKIISRNGRVVAKRAASTLDNSDSAEEKDILHYETVVLYGQNLDLLVRGQIIPALDVLLVEHRITEDDLIAIAMRSSLIPKERALLWGKGLHLGFEHDFAGAIHILIPQIEEMLRYHLKAAGVRVTTLDEFGIETENSINTLIDLAEAKTLLGNDLHFEIKTLLCDPCGAKIRNQLAHGLMTHGDCFTPHAIYTWWLCFSIVYQMFWNAVRTQRELETNPPPA